MARKDPVKNRLRQQRNMQDYRARKRAHGLCAYGGCWEPAPDHYYCPAHQEQRNARERARRRMR